MTRAEGLLRGRLIARNVILSVAGQLLPLLVAVFAIPRLVAALGLDRFGVLTLGWSLVGYLSLFDLGIGWAVTRLASERLAAGRSASIPSLAWTSVLTSTALGALGAAALAAATPWLVGRALSIPAPLEAEARRAFMILATSLPFVTATAGITGVLAAHQRFDLIQAVRAPMMAGLFLAPLLTLRISGGLVPVFASLAAVRIAAGLAQLLLARRARVGLEGPPVMSRPDLSALLRFGGWVSVSNVVGPILVSFDRFVIGAMLSMAAVAQYAAPYEIATRLFVLTVPIASVLYPAFSATYGHDPVALERLFRWGLRTVFLVLFPCVLGLVALAPELISVWLGLSFDASSARVLRWLAAGVLINGLAQVAFTFVQGAGRPELPARLHLLELPAYLVTLFLMIRWRGIEGAAIAWVLRVTVDAAVLFAIGGRLAPMVRLSAPVVGIGAAAGALLAAAFLLPGLAARAGLLALVIALAAALAWRLVVRPLAAFNVGENSVR